MDTAGVDRQAIMRPDRALGATVDAGELDGTS